MADSLILVVDDNEMNRDMLSRRLKRQKYDVMVAEDGAVALEMATQHPFNLIFLDIMMPGLSGYEVLETLKSDPKLQHIPVIMISAVDDLDSVVRCIEMGAEDYLFKPFNPVLLKARVSAILGKQNRAPSVTIPTDVLTTHIQTALSTVQTLLNQVDDPTVVEPLNQVRVQLEASEKIMNH